MAMVNWSIVTSAQYFAEGVTYDENTLYFLSDTGEIYRGAKSFSESVIMVDDAAAGSFDAALAAITTPARKKLYVSATTLAAKTYNGTAWKDVIKPLITAGTGVTADVADQAVAAKAVVEYVESKIAELNGSGSVVTGITYDKNTKKIIVTSGDADEELLLDGLGVELAYDAATGALTLKDVSGAVLGTAVNLDLERFVSAAAYDETSKTIYLAFTGVNAIAGGTWTYPGTMPADPTEGLAAKAGDKWYIYKDAAWAEIDAADVPLGINVADLVDTYSAEDSETLTLSVTANKFKGAVKVSAEAGNTLEAKADGLYVAAVDLATTMKLVADAVENNIATFGTGGQVKDSGVAVGGATLAETPTAMTLATEAAVAAIRAALQTSIDGKIAKVDGAVAGNVATFAADGELADAGIKVGGATLAATPNDKTVATEAAVKAAIDGGIDGVKKTTLESADTDDTVPTSKAVVDALTWKTTM